MSNSKLEEYLRIYDEGSVIMREGDVGDAVFLIKSGKVDIVKGTGAEERKLTTLGDGEVVGEMAMGKGEHERTATVKAVTEVEGWRFPGDAFETLIEKEKEFRQKLFKSLVDRLIYTTDRLTEWENSELQEINNLLVDSAHIFLTELESKELEEDNDKDREVRHSDEYLAYRYDVDPELLDRFQSTNNDQTLDDLKGDERIDIIDLVQDIVRDTSSHLNVKYSQSGEADDELVDVLRSARDSLRELEDHTETYDNEELQDVMEDRKDYLDVLEDAKEDGRDDFVIQLLENLLTGIKQEVNIRYE